MSRLHKKCFIASASMHLLLLIVLFASPAFHQAEKDPDLPVLNFIPTRLTDDPFSGGGPNVTAPPAAAPQAPLVQPEVKPPVTPPPAEPEPPKPVRMPEPEPVVELPSAKTQKPAETPKPTKPKPVAAARTDAAEKQEKKPKKIVPTFVPAKDVAKSKEAERARERAAQAKAQEERKRYLDRVGRITRDIAQNLSSGTAVTMPPGTGGEFYANYAQVVKSIYQNAWNPPRELDNDAATVTVKVVIASEGNVVSAVIIDKSGVRELDESVARTLKAVTFVARFPEGAKDKERTFLIEFDLKSER